MSIKKDFLNKAVEDLSNRKVPAGPSRELIESTAAKVNQMNREVIKKIPDKHASVFERIRTMKNLTKIAVAALFIVAAGLGIVLLDKSVSTAYAFNQTIEASHSVRWIHIKESIPSAEDDPMLLWAQFGDDGKPLRIRLDSPDWASGGDGPKAAVWGGGKAMIWFKKKGGVVIVPEEKIAVMIQRETEKYDPKLAVTKLQQLAELGKVKIDIDEPADKQQPIVVTAEYLQGSNDYGKKVVLFVDQATKLVTRAERYSMNNGSYKVNRIAEFIDYNVPIADEVFQLSDIPDDVMRIDQTTTEVGLVQGQMTDDQVAVQVARQFFQAVIDKDYAKAGSLLEGAPAEMIREIFEDKMQMRALKIVSVGPVEKHPNPATGGVVVPCVIEMEKDGEVTEVSFDKLGVRPVYNQPGRWTIFGGL